MNIDKATLDELKAARPGGLYQGTIRFTDDEDRPHEVEFIYRKPIAVDMESYTKGCQKNPIMANQNLVQSLIVYPEARTIIDQLREYPLVVGRFVDEMVSPFFGANITMEKEKV